MTAPDGYASKTTHTDIRVDQHLYRILFERSPDAVVVTAPDGAILDFNPAALDLFGLARSALQQANIEAFYAKRNDRDGLMASVNQHGLIHAVPTLFVGRQNQKQQKTAACREASSERS